MLLTLVFVVERVVLEAFEVTFSDSVLLAVGFAVFGADCQQHRQQQHAVLLY